MIDNPEPQDWKALQDGACRLFNEIGLTSKTNVELPTPRGHVAVDVYAVDEHSVDKIKYVVECKNWASPVPKSVVHSFTTVMHETGANIGFIISKYGLQSGAKAYTANTNIVGLTYRELQSRYFRVWWERHFCVNAAAAADSALQYVEPINSARERAIGALPAAEATKVRQLQRRYGPFVMLVQIMDIGHIIPQYLSQPMPDISLYKKKLEELLGEPSCFASEYYRDLLAEVSKRLSDIEEQFNGIFGRNIFSGET